MISITHSDEVVWRRRVWSVLPPVVILVTAAGIWLAIVYGMRIKELQYRLKSNNDQIQSVRTLSLVSRYQLLRQKAGERDHALNYGREGRLMQALQHTAANENTPELGLAEKTALWTIEFFNVIAASPRFRYEQSSPLFRDLEAAYYHELRRSYKAAIEKYSALLESKNGLETDWQAYVLLHRGFCRALAGQRPEALADFELVIKNHTKGEYHLTAQALKAMVAEINSELVKVALMAPSADKGAAFYRLTAYDQAIRVFKGLADLNSNPSAMFYLGRSYEESGGAKRAAEYYRNVITHHANTKWAVRANRRLFAMGTFYSDGKEYRLESKSNVKEKIVDDAGLLLESKRYETIASRIDDLKGENRSTFDAIAVPKDLAKTSMQILLETDPVSSKREFFQRRPRKRQPRNGEEMRTGRRELPLQPEQLAKTLPEISEPDIWLQRQGISQHQKRELLRSQRSLLRLTMENGNVFTGILIREDKNAILLFTVLGILSVDGGQVLTRETINQN